MVQAGRTIPVAAKAYQEAHPLEPDVTAAEIEAALVEEKVKAARTRERSHR